MTLLNVTVPASPVALGAFAAGGAVNDISLGINNTYVFAATSALAAGLQIVSIETPSAPVLVGSLNLTAIQYGVAYNAAQNRAYVAGENNTEEVTSVAPQ